MKIKSEAAEKVTKDTKRGKKCEPDHALSKLCKAMIELASHQLQMENLKISLIKSRQIIDDLSIKDGNRLPCLKLTMQDGVDIFIPVVINTDHDGPFILHECVGVEIEHMFFSIRDLKQRVMPFLKHVVGIVDTTLEEIP
jgi:hypothetical protein